MLNAANISHRYGNGPWLFRDLSLQVGSGEILAVLGPNARGKTTLLKCLSHLIKPAEGSCTTEGGIGYVPQSHSTSHTYSVLEMVLMGRARQVSAWSTPGQADIDLAVEALAKVGMDHLWNRNYSKLSGGQRQLILMARALVSQPATIVLDEPTSALDMRNQAVVLSVVNDLARNGMGVIITTHDPSHALEIASQVLLMTDEGYTLDSAEALLRANILTDLYKTPILEGEIESSHGTRTVIVPDFLAAVPAS